MREPRSLEGCPVCNRESWVRGKVRTWERRTLNTTSGTRQPRVCPFSLPHVPTPNIGAARKNAPIRRSFGAGSKRSFHSSRRQFLKQAGTIVSFGQRQAATPASAKDAPASFRNCRRDGPPALSGATNGNSASSQRRNSGESARSSGLRQYSAWERGDVRTGKRVVVVSRSLC